MSRKPLYISRYPSFKRHCDMILEKVERDVFKDDVTVAIHEMCPLHECNSSTRGMCMPRKGLIDIYLENVWIPASKVINRMRFLFTLLHEYSHYTTQSWSYDSYDDYASYIELDMDRRAVEIMAQLGSEWYKNPPMNCPDSVLYKFVTEKQMEVLAGWLFQFNYPNNPQVFKYPLHKQLTTHLRDDWTMTSRMLSSIKGFK